jgi:ketol-acid reductoisomerase
MLLNFAHGYNIHYKYIEPRRDVDVIMIGPRMIGKGVRDTFVRGHGFPSLVAVHHDATGRAKARMLALAKGIGTTRMGAIESSFREETEIDLFSEQSADIHIPRLMFEALTEAGFDPDVAILEIYASGELSEMYAEARDIGLWHQLKLHSRTSQYGQQITGRQWLDFDGTKAQFRQVINHIRSGKFAAEWAAEETGGCRNLVAVTDENLKHPMQIAENRLYRMLGRRKYDLQDAYWLKGKKEPANS